MKNKQQHIEAWTKENTPLGRDLGYPECCIKEFCAQPPVVLKYSKATKADKKRYQAGKINGVFTGFIPCIKHAEEILARKIKLEDLIKNRNPEFPPFPTYAQK